MGRDVKPSVFYIDYEAINKKGTCSSKDILLFHIQPNALFLLKNKHWLTCSSISKIDKSYSIVLQKKSYYCFMSD